MSAQSGPGGLEVSADLELLAPKFKQAVIKARDACNEAKLNVVVYEAYRSQKLQALYFARGRTVIPPKHTVTNAPTNLHSWHGYGLAVDVVHRTKFWKPADGLNWFRQVAEIFKRYDCKWGGDWTHADPPHFQWHLCRPSPSDEARHLIQTEGLEAVWRKVQAV